MESNNMCARSLNTFEDIIKDRRGTSNFMWMSREWKPIPAYNHVCKTNPHKLKQSVMNSPRLQLVIEEVSAEQNLPKELLYKDVWSILEEVGQKRDVGIIRWLGMFLVTMLKRCCDGVFVNESQVNKVRCTDTIVILSKTFSNI